jgi:hypothetical protein
MPSTIRSMRSNRASQVAITAAGCERLRVAVPAVEEAAEVAWGDDHL